jgi:putative nucleotidyltransferase with HDIG domain
MVSGSDYKRRVYAIRDLPTLPVIAQKILTLAGDDDASIKQLTALISSDQSLSLRILALANSAYYGHRAKIGTVQHAVGIIGTTMLKQLSLSVLVCGMIGRGGRDRAEFWRHSFGTATAAALVAKRAGMAEGDLCFMAGLLHDVGKIIIDTHFADDAAIQHTDVGGWLAERWELPEALVKAIAYHHSMDAQHIREPIVACVHAANLCAKAAMDDPTPAVAPEVLDALKLTPTDLFEIGRELSNRRGQIDSLLT